MKKQWNKDAFFSAVFELKSYLLLLFTQTLSQLGSAVTGFALVIWLYQNTGSALDTALLAVCSYAPYIVMSIFAGALSDRWNKKLTMLVCDAAAAATTLAVLALMRMERLEPWHLYVINAVSGLMNTVQQPASEVASTLLIPRHRYQQTSALRSMLSSVSSLLTPVLAAGLLTLGGMELVIWVDLSTFVPAFVTLLLFIRLPAVSEKAEKPEPLLQSARSGLRFLRGKPGILWIILFLAAINLVASMYNAALPAYLLSCPNGGEGVLGLVSTVTGIATLLGSAVAVMLPKPKSRVKVVCVTLFLSMSTENFILALGREPWMWCVGALLGWLPIPLMNANLDVIMRTSIPPQMQGRVYACRNTLQFFTIPVGYFLGGWLIDAVFEPLMARVRDTSVLHRCFGVGKGSGAAMLFLILAFSGVLVCVVFSQNRHIRRLADSVKD